MEMAVQELSDGVCQIVLSGRLDTAGAGQIDLRFGTLAGARRGLVVDLSGVTFLASLGIRVLLIGAKATAAKGGKMVLLSPDANILSVLTMARIDTLIPVFHDQAAALAAVTP